MLTAPPLSRTIRAKTTEKDEGEERKGRHRYAETGGREGLKGVEKV